MYVLVGFVDRCGAAIQRMTVRSDATFVNLILVQGNKLR